MSISLVTLACGGGSETATSPANAPIEIGANPLLEGEFATLAGETIDLGSLQGEDVVLWFWAPW